MGERNRMKELEGTLYGRSSSPTPSPKHGTPTEKKRRHEVGTQRGPASPFQACQSDSSAEVSIHRPISKLASLPPALDTPLTFPGFSMTAASPLPLGLLLFRSPFPLHSWSPEPRVHQPPGASNKSRPDRGKSQGAALALSQLPCFSSVRRCSSCHHRPYRRGRKLGTAVQLSGGSKAPGPHA